MRIMIALAVATLMITAARAEEAAPSARYAMTPIEGGALRLDTLTGAVDRCAMEEGAWRCRAVPVEGEALQDEIDRLAEENAELRAKIAEGGSASSSDDLTMRFHLPSEAEVDKAMSFMERILKRFKSMVEDLHEDEKGTAL